MSAADRLSRIVAEYSADGGGVWSSRRLCEATRDIVDVSGAGVMLMSGDLPTGSLCTTNDVSHRIEDLQYTLGEGPCVDAHHQGRVVLEPDLAHPTTPRWLAFTQEAMEAGVRAVFAFPLRLGAARLGAVDLYLDRPGRLNDQQHADAIAMAGVIAGWILDVQAKAPRGGVAEELERNADWHYVVHNAAGAVSVQRGISVIEALIQLRAYAFSHDRPLRVVAEDVVARRLQF